MDSGRSIPAGVHPARVFFNLDKVHAVFIDDDEIDRAAALRGWEDPIALPHKMFSANKLANVAVDVPLVRHTRQCESVPRCGQPACPPDHSTGC